MATQVDEGDDPYLWLEELEGADAVRWVRERNAETAAALTEGEAFASLRAEIRQVLDADDRIPYPGWRGDGFYYNFWTDTVHPRGVWRRTPLDQYRRSEPEWDVLLDLDALAAEEGENWVWQQVTVLRPGYRRCLISLSRGGADAVVVREFDLVRRDFVEDGFTLPEAKTDVCWIDVDHIFVGTDFGPGSLTSSGYPRVVKRWRRGTPVSAAVVVHEGRADDVAVHAWHEPTPGFARDFVGRSLDFYRVRKHLLTGAGELVPIDVPEDADSDVHREWLLIRLRSAWTDPPVGQHSRIVETDPDHGDAYLLDSEGFLQPATLRLGQVGGPAETLKRAPAFFDPEGLAVRQFFATSVDGTRVPYFVVGKADAAGGPALLTGYGGYEIPMTPNYSGVIGRGWLARGGTYVVANIRGGGEYGPRWHRAALRENRLRAYEDFAAVAADLVTRGITTPRQLGVEGGSNGGLLMGVMLTRYPALFGAVVAHVPVLDMRRYHRLLAGASWIAEYGDPDREEDWAYLREYSPYHNVRAGEAYPPVLLVTSTRDDRVHPAHARKTAARLREHGHDVAYHESVEGGHGAAANNEQRAFVWTLTLEFLWRKLAGPDRTLPRQVSPGDAAERVGRGIHR
ncbi:prolyl oligopeptidase family serine peptidase [Micromonospora tulbaghiae]